MRNIVVRECCFDSRNIRKEEKKKRCTDPKSVFDCFCFHDFQVLHTDKSAWKLLSVFPKVYLVEGNPMSFLDLGNATVVVAVVVVDGH